MPMLFLQQLIDTVYSLKGETYDFKNPILNEKFNFSPLSSKENNYIYNKEVKTSDVNIWDKDIRLKYFHMTDNDNGGMLIEITQKYNSDGSPKNYGDMFDIKIGFVLGNEETYYYNPALADSVQIENPFERLVSAKEYMMKTFNDIDGTMQFLSAFETILNYFGVEQVVDEESEKIIEDRVKYIERTVQNLIRSLNLNLKVPKELTLSNLETMYK